MLLFFSMDPSSVVLFVFLFAFSAFFSGSEIALMSLPDHTIDSLLKQQAKNAKALKYIKNHSDKLLITILIGNNLVNVFAATYAAQVALALAESWWREQGTAIAIATWVITFLTLFFGEIMPKTLATRYSVSISLFIAPIYRFLMMVLYPVILFIEFLTRLFGNKQLTRSVTDEEIEAIIDMGQEHGVLDSDEYLKVKKVLQFNETTVEEIMTPRVRIEAINKNATVKQAIQTLMGYTHTRIPVYDDTIDVIKYVVTLRDLIELDQKWKQSEKIKHVGFDPVLKVPLTLSINTLLETFRRERKHIAIVIDEYGGTAWLVTLEDCIEEVFGEIQDETDDEMLEIQKITDNQWLLSAEVGVVEMLETAGLTLRDVEIDDAEFDGENMSYFLTSHFGRFPKKGEIAVVYNTWEVAEHILSLKVVEVDDHKIVRVLVKKLLDQQTRDE